MAVYVICLVRNGEAYDFLSLFTLMSSSLSFFSHEKVCGSDVMGTLPLDFDSVFKLGFELGAWVCTIDACLLRFISPSLLFNFLMLRRAAQSEYLVVLSASISRFLSVWARHSRSSAKQPLLSVSMAWSFGAVEWGFRGVVSWRQACSCPCPFTCSHLRRNSMCEMLQQQRHPHQTHPNPLSAGHLFWCS